MIVSWNVTWLNNLGKCREVSSCLNNMKPDLAILIEIRVKQHKAEAIWKKIGGNQCFKDNYSKHPNGRIQIMWYPFKIKISFKFCTSQLLHMGIHNLSDNLQSWCNVIYAHNTLEQRQIPWKDIERLQTNIQIPWFLMGVLIMSSCLKIVWVATRFMKLSIEIQLL